MNDHRLITLFQPLSCLLLIILLMFLSIPMAMALGTAFFCLDYMVLPILRKTAWGSRKRVTCPAACQAKTHTRIEQPVSIVIPTWNARDLLDLSLAPLFAALNDYAPGGEIIVIDNHSTDDTRSYIKSRFSRVRLIELSRNEGFAKAANRGIAESRYPTVILLNNDMVVEKNFILPLLKPFEDEPATFGVSAQIYFLDKNKPRWETGKVHMRWELGSLSLFHLYQWNPNHIYPVAYAGGGASAYDREKLLALGGFDQNVFQPVYIEDVDLGYRAWKRGWPSFFAPKSVVHHKHRGTSSRLWSESTIYSFFLKNLAALVWKNVNDKRFVLQHLVGLLVLPHRAYKGFGTICAIRTFWGLVRQIPRVLRARIIENLTPPVLDDKTIMRVSRYRYAFRALFKHRHPGDDQSRKKILVVSAYSPYPPVHGGAVRMFALLKQMRHFADIDLISYVDTPEERSEKSIAELEKICRHVVLIERNDAMAGKQLDPRQTRGFKSQKMFDAIELFLDQTDYDVVQLEYTHMAHYMPHRINGMQRVLVEHDVSFVALSRGCKTFSGLSTYLMNWYDWMRLLRYEIRAVKNADRVVVMSENDKTVLGKFIDDRSIDCIPNGVDCQQFTFQCQAREPDSILFVGFFRHEPNVQAVEYFHSRVLPLVRQKRPQCRFRVAGAFPPHGIRRLAREDNIEVTGKVEDIGAYYRGSAVFVAPILKGSGTRLKILEAMASGCPVVSTTIGAEGLDIQDGRHLLLGDTPETMADAIDKVLSDATLSDKLTRMARELVLSRYDWRVIVDRLITLYNERQP